ncbi:hypothetical protein SAMN00120144_2328 [Hymenobacter roseosalivarius DSM 11622]|uniref:Secreted protein n=1 Tax=Hymenobacter roseosalivarius DSM 11622 TaxID=645990 RepID=A0A1W1VKX5_9BACT|nr:hypothetical protein [Hymenobacter roseosalivarius]SMB94039.1 hypothetical protein SAMN00120144_2328 [Hymenobacter roseosalivarius DSM 11622]
MKQLLLVVGLVLGLSGVGFAQQDTLDVNSTKPGREYRGFALGEVTTPEGRKIRLYLPVSTDGFGKVLSFYDKSPDIRSKPKMKMIGVDKVQSMVVEGIYSETMIVEGKNKKVLATRLLEGPAELFNYAEAEAIPIPVAPLAGAVMVMAAIPYTNNHWYVRRGGELVEVKRSIFRQQMTEYFKDCPELAQKIQQDLSDYQYRDMRAIIAQYNLLLAAKASK